MTQEYQSDFVPMKGKFTGRKMLAIVVAFFAVIITVNLFMAYKAVGTFPGLVVKNSYVASQEFDRNRTAPVGDLAGGNWNVLLKAHAKDGTLFQQRTLLYVSGR